MPAGGNVEEERETTLSRTLVQERDRASIH